MNPKQISQDDLIAFALEDLSPAEAAEVTVHLEHSETARAELAQIHADLAMYALTSELHSPPALARERMLRSIAKERKPVPVERAVPPVPVAAGVALLSRGERTLPAQKESRQRRSGLGFFGWAGWAVACGCAAIAGVEYHQHQNLQDQLSTQTARMTEVTNRAARAEAVMQVLTDGGATQMVLRQPVSDTEPPKPEGHAAYASDTGSLVFVGTHLPALEPYKTYELWVIPVDGGAPVPAGLFKPNLRGFASVVLPELPRGIVAKTLGVTVEDDGGSKSPTTPIILEGM